MTDLLKLTAVCSPVAGNVPVHYELTSLKCKTKIIIHILYPAPSHPSPHTHTDTHTLLFLCHAFWIPYVEELSVIGSQCKDQLVPGG